MKKKITKEKVAPEIAQEVVVAPIAPLTQEFSNGDMNTLRDKINEIIQRG
jgi:hypothetical protein